MQRKSRIRYTTSDRARLRDLQQRVNRRIYYERSKGGDTSHLPDTIKLKDLEGSIATRADYNFQLNQMKRLLTKDAMETVTAESGRKFTKGQVRQVQSNVRRENIKRYHKRKKQEKLDLESGRLLGSNMSDANQKREFDMLSYNPKYLDKTLERISRMSMDKDEFDKASLYQENYIKAIIETYSSQDVTGQYIIDNDTKELIDKLRKINPFEFEKRYRTDDRFEIKFVYIREAMGESPIKYLNDLWSL